MFAFHYYYNDENWKSIGFSGKLNKNHEIRIKIFDNNFDRLLLQVDVWMLLKVIEDNLN